MLLVLASNNAYLRTTSRERNLEIMNEQPTQKTSLDEEAERLYSQGFEEVWIPKTSPAFEKALKQLHETHEVVALDGDVEVQETRRVFRKQKQNSPSETTR